MKTIAVSIDLPTLASIDRIARQGAAEPAGTGRRRARAARLSRSQIVRQALQDFVERHDRLAREAQEREVLARHRARLARQAAALVAAQAEP